MAKSNDWLSSSLTNNILNVIFLITLTIITVYVLWIPISAYSTVFSWHVILTTLSLLPLALLGIVLFCSNNVWLQGIDRKTKALVHEWLMVLSLLLLIVGIGLEIDRSIQIVDYPHSSAHCITGLMCMILSIFAGLYGVCAHYSQRLKNVLRPVVTKFIHNVLGQAVFIVGIISLCCGYYTNWFVYYTSEEARVLVTIATTTICALTLVHSVKSAFNQFTSIINK